MFLEAYEQKTKDNYLSNRFDICDTMSQSIERDKEMEAMLLKLNNPQRRRVLRFERIGVFLVLVSSLPLITTKSSEARTLASSKHDLYWEELRSDFYDSPFFGDGVQGGTLLRDTNDSSAARVLLGHYEAITHSAIPKWEYCESRVYAASVLAKPFNVSEKVSARTDIVNGYVSSEFVSGREQAKLTVFADRKEHVTVIRLDSSQPLPDEALRLSPEHGISARLHIEKPPTPVPVEYQPPLPRTSKEGEVTYILNPMAKKGGHAVASRVVRMSNKSLAIVVAIAGSDLNDPEEAVIQAKGKAKFQLDCAIETGIAPMEKGNADWWRKFWSNSSVSLPDDPYWEKFWHLNLYKFASASSESKPLLIDTCGPWIWKSGWAAIWWNLNVQLSYMPMYGSNQLDTGRSYWLGVKRLYDSGTLHRNADGRPGIHIGRSTTQRGAGSWGTELGNLPWVIHGLWKHWKYSLDAEIGRDLIPMVVDCLKYQESFLQTGPDGKLHVRESRSPEYRDGEFFYRDANYALAGIRFLLQALTELKDHTGIEVDDYAHWQELGKRLTDFPINEHGLMIGEGQGFDHSHRHYSHLLALYPYHLINPENGPISRTLYRSSVDRWLGLKGGHAGYTFTGGSAMYATLGDGENAYQTLQQLKPRLTPNTMYAEGSPVIETPLSAVESINYMLLQSWGGTIRIFPAVPSAWKKASFNNLRAEGAFLVSSSINNGSISHLEIRSEKGGRMQVRNPWPKAKVHVLRENGQTVSMHVAEETIEFQTQRGATYTFKQVGGSN